MHRASASCVVLAFLNSTVHCWCVVVRSQRLKLSLSFNGFCWCAFGINRLTLPGVTTVRSQTIFIISTQMCTVTLMPHMAMSLAGSLRGVQASGTEPC